MRIGGMLAAAVGVVLVLGGLLFLVGAGGQSQRYLIGALAIAIGAGAAWLGARTARAADAASPDRVRHEVLALAERHDGELSMAEVEAALGVRFGVAREVLRSMADESTCRRVERGGATRWIFESLLPRLMLRRCPYCDHELPVAEEVHQCPHCGGQVELKVEARSLGEGEHYGMDG